MKQIQKHSFEAVSLLTADNGMLDISIIPAIGQPDWLVPTALILNIEHYEERIWTYLWKHGDQAQEVAVYHLIPKEIPADKLVILEGNTDVHRLALQTTGEVTNLRLRISDVKDVELNEEEMSLMKLSMPALPTVQSQHDNYLYQAVEVAGELYVVPDLDLIVHHLVDLDG
ncbi:hypothetical protein [Moraxella oblonga]|uniref:hypothetical protein n=1 Tax=Moraxella oblonga TaxID=200413 RepID=UPI000834F4CB|nr:hypothetical protein [Moraxella oblonga]